MNLKEWLSQNGMSGVEFAERIGVQQSSVSRYTRGIRIPDRKVAQRIYLETRGAVTPNDFCLNGGDVAEMTDCAA